MPPTPSESDAQSHQALLDSLDIALKPRSFRNPNWKPSQRRNKNVKQIIGEAARREASTMATQNNSGSTTPALQQSTPGNATPLLGVPGQQQQNIAQAAQNLSQLVLEKNLQASIAAGAAGSGTLGEGSRLGPGGRETGGAGTPGGSTTGGGQTGGITGIGGPVATYTNIESAPSLHPAHQRPYCDITGLPAPYRDPKTRLRYHNKEVFAMIRTLPQGVAEQYLAARGAHVILK